MRGNVRRRGKPQAPSWWQKWRKWVLFGGGGGTVAIIALIVGVWLMFSSSRPSVVQQDELRERLTTSGFAHELREESGGLSGDVWVPPKADGMVIFQETRITISGGKCESVTASLYASNNGKGPAARKQQLGSFSFSPGSGVAVKDTPSGTPQPLVDRARREFEQMTSALSGPTQKGK